MKAKIYKIHGRVQGVGFRYFVYTHATKLGVKGFVQNEVDGTVTVVAQGEENILGELEKILRIGPATSHVEEIESWEFPIDEYETFEIR